MSSSVIAWRLVKTGRVASAFDGEGAFRFGGRWNERGQRMVYASSTLSLALLEILAHIDPAGKVPQLSAVAVHIPKSLIQPAPIRAVACPSEPFGWTLAETREIGADWLNDSPYPVMQVPSAIVPLEKNYLLNPAQRDFKKCRIEPPAPFRFDPRLLSS